MPFFPAFFSSITRNFLFFLNPFWGFNLNNANILTNTPLVVYSLKKKIYPIEPIYSTLSAPFANFATTITVFVPDLQAKVPLAPGLAPGMSSIFLLRFWNYWFLKALHFLLNSCSIIKKQTIEISMAA
jgi:hypothetical protein